MADYTLLQSGDADAAENIGALTGQSNQGNYVEYGLQMSPDFSAGTVDVSEGKAFVLLDTALAEWTDDSGTNHSATRHRVSVALHYDARTKNLATTSGTNYVFCDPNLSHDDTPLIAINSTGNAPNSDSIEIARLNPGENPDYRNDQPSGEYGSLTVHDQLEDPAGVVHTDELADAADIRTDGEINTAVNQNATHGSDAPHEYYTSGDAVADINAEDSLDVDIAGEAGSVAGSNVTSPVAEADHATEADNADTVGNISPSDFLRTDTKDRMFADADWNDHAIHNLDSVSFSSSSGIALDLRPNSDGSHQVVAHDDPDSGREYRWQSSPGANNGRVMRLLEGPADDDHTELFGVGTGGDVHVPEGDVFSDDGRLASQTWVNQNHINAKGDSMSGSLDMQGETLSGLDNIQSSDGPINVRDPVDFNGNPLRDFGDMQDHIPFETGYGIRDEQGGQRTFEMIPRVLGLSDEYGRTGPIPENEAAVINMDDSIVFVESDSNDVKAYIDTGTGGPTAPGGGRGIFEGQVVAGELAARHDHGESLVSIGNAKIVGDLEVTGEIINS